MKPYYQDNHIRIFNKDCWSMDELPDESVDLIATDPPYGISFMGKDWDTFNEVVPPQGAYQHKKGFKKLPRQNTASMTEFFVPIWGECLRILKSGGFAFVMCSPRADVMAKQVICLREAGFEVGFTPIYWTYASGFPKAQNIGKAVDKRLGVEREVIGKEKVDVGMQSGSMHSGRPIQVIERDKTVATSPQAKALDGSYGGFQPKPAVEVIIVAMKPLSEKTYVDQALKNRKGITWLDDCRIGMAGGTKRSHQATFQHNGIVGEVHATRGYRTGHTIIPIGAGRFPANLLVSDDVLNDGIKTTSRKGDFRKAEINNQTRLNNSKFVQVNCEYSDSGSFSRYFDLDAWWAERIKELPESVQRTFPFLIVPKASKSEKNKGIGVAVLRTTHGSTPRKNEAENKSPNPHPTVKPLKLMSYLITLGSREGDTVLDPFIGTGTTAIACQILGRRCTGYEINPDYCEIAKGRLTWCRQKVLL